MPAFLAAAALLVVAALAFLLPPLLVRRDPGAKRSSVAANVDVVRDQLAELEADLVRGTLSPERHAEARRELERRLLEDTADAAPAPAEAPPKRPVALAVVVAVLVPALAAGLYAVLGNPAALDRATRQGMTDEQVANRDKVRDLTAKLEARMQQKPDDAQGWEMLGRAYRMQDKLPQALRAYERAVLLDPKNPVALADYAELLALGQGGRIDGAAAEAAERALALDPRSDKALALLGTGAFDARQYDRAIGYWQRLLALAPPGSPFAQAVQQGIDEARAAKAEEAKPDSAGARVATAVTGRVVLAPALEKQVSPDDTVFVTARAVDGPPMPLAVVRRRVADLPFDFVLDDSMAMAPELKLSSAASVVVTARVSKRGQPIRAPGDFEGRREPVRPGDRDVVVTIDRVVQ
ncbi:MAG: c-type cytochrome biogenesis protein CcmI [Burkholderiales bacterium]|jgi:cytochrome c-type biogenesis protein CcmH|nr:c-type cytochrome biogenesis protein CcmI [Burkholderiales bacterium]